MVIVACQFCGQYDAKRAVSGLSNATFLDCPDTVCLEEKDIIGFAAMNYNLATL